MYCNNKIKQIEPATTPQGPCSTFSSTEQAIFSFFIYILTLPGPTPQGPCSTCTLTRAAGAALCRPRFWPGASAPSFLPHDPRSLSANKYV